MRGEATTSDMNGISWRTMDLSILLQSANRQLTLLPMEVIENNGWNEKRKWIGRDGETGNGWTNAVHRLNDRSWFGVDVRDRSVESVKWFLWAMNPSEWRRNLHERREIESSLLPSWEWMSSWSLSGGRKQNPLPWIPQWVQTADWTILPLFLKSYQYPNGVEDSSEECLGQNTGSDLRWLLEWENHPLPSCILNWIECALQAPSYPERRKWFPEHSQLIRYYWWWREFSKRLQ